MAYLESKYTMELRYMVEDRNFHLFDFDYEFYDNDLKPVFEKLFIDYYYFNEIGFETVGRFKKMLQTKLNVIAPYYKERYITIIEGKKCNFLLNKDLKETFIRELNGIENSTSNNSSENVDQANQNIINRDNLKESNLDNGIAELTEDKITLESMNIVNSENVSRNNNKYSSENKGNKNNNEKETTTLISQGNIGTTSSGSLLTDWRESIININEEILKECRNLFMLIY